MTGRRVGEQQQQLSVVKEKVKGYWKDNHGKYCLGRHNTLVLGTFENSCFAMGGLIYG